MNGVKLACMNIHVFELVLNLKYIYKNFSVLLLLLYYTLSNQLSLQKELTWVKTMVNIACERLLTSFMLVEAVVLFK